MRYLGNKTRLLPEIERAAGRLDFSRGTMVDLFAGSGVVSRFFRGRGNRVLSNDLMASSHLFQKLYLEWEAAPQFESLRRELDLPKCRIRHDSESGRRRQSEGETLNDLPGNWQATESLLAFMMTEIEPVEGVTYRQYSPGGASGRAYFRPERAAEIDGILTALRDWHRRAWIDTAELSFLIAILIDAADRRANISGTYGAYLKTWQANTGKALDLRRPQLVSGPLGRAHQGDALQFLPGVEADLLYLDPPYNGRQYPSNYHLFEVLTHLAFDEDLAAFEASIYGKTGLIPWRHKASKLCSQRGSECRDFMRELLMATEIPRVVISYSEEGILDADDFDEILAEYADIPVSKLGRRREDISYRRFRSDADGRVASTGAERQYKTVPGRDRNEVCEWLYFVSRAKG